MGTSIPRPSLNKPAPTIQLADSTGQKWLLEDQKGSIVVLIFNRHIHCLPCAAHAADINEKLNELGENTKVVLVTFTDPESLQKYQTSRPLSFPILVDENLEAYKAFGLGRGSIFRIYGWRVIRRYYQILRKDGFAELARPTEDTLQLGGDFIIDPEGNLAWGLWGEGPDDRPTVNDLIEAIRKIKS